MQGEACFLLHFCVIWLPINSKQKTVCGIIPNKALNAKTIKDAQMRSCFCSLFP